MTTDLKALLLDPAYRARLLALNESDSSAAWALSPVKSHFRAALELIGELSIADKLAWRYAHGEIEAACGGKTANMVRERVLMRREKIDAENEMRKAKP